jgi:hypothetical protein
MFSQHTTATRKRRRRNVVTFFVVIGKAAKRELVPQVEMAQFNFRAELDVAGEQAKRGRLGQRAQGVDQFPDAGADLRLAAGEDVVEPENVTPEKLREMFRRFRQGVDFEKFTDEADIGAAGKLHFFRAVMQVEFRGEGFGESLRPGVACVNKRAVNVEQNQFYHARKISGKTFRARFLVGWPEIYFVVHRMPGADTAVKRSFAIVHKTEATPNPELVRSP